MLLGFSAVNTLAIISISVLAVKNMDYKRAIQLKDAQIMQLQKEVDEGKALKDGLNKYRNELQNLMNYDGTAGSQVDI